MRLFTTLGIAAVVGIFAVACSSDSGGGGGGGAAGAAGSGTGGSGTGGSGTGGSGTGGAAGSGTGGSATGGAAGSATGGAAGSSGNDCTPCLGTNCTTEIGACTADPDCGALLTCASTCNDSACVDDCFTSNPDGAQTFQDTVVACAEEKCATECAGAFPAGG